MSERNVVCVRTSNFRCLAALCLVVAACGGGGDLSDRTAALNLLLITLDTVRADHLGAYGAQNGQTPQLDALAARGVMFEQAYSPAPMTLPAHATLLTGVEPPEHGVRVNGAHQLPPDIPTLAERLSARGYRAGAFVAAHVLDAKFGLDRGFEVYDDDLTGAYEQDVPDALSVYRQGSAVVDAAIGWLGEPVRDESGRPPFFLWVHLYDAHYPWRSHEELSATPGAEGASYAAEVAYLDLQVGRLLAALAEHGMDERTLVFAIADHGEGLGDHHEIEHGYLLNEEVLRVPWIAAGPGIAGGVRVEALVSLRDFMPTVLAMLGDEAPAESTGRNLVPALRGEEVASMPSYGETDLPWVSYRWSSQRSLTTDDWRYVHSSQPELYDRQRDPGELVNLASARPEVRRRLEGELAALEASLGARKSVSADVSAAEREQLASLGYVISHAEESIASDSPPDVKERLIAKDLAAELRRGQADGSLGAAERLAIAQELVRLSPETPAFRGQLGLALVDAGELVGGVARLREAVALDPASASALYDLGNVLERQGEISEARVLFERALTLDSSLAPAHVGMGNVWLAEDRPALAAGHYEEALRLRPAYPEAHFNFAQTLLQRGRASLAIDHLASAAARPGWAEAEFALADVLRREGRLGEAIPHYEAGLASEPTNADAQNDLGVVLLESGRTRDARAHFSAALRLRPVFFRPHINLGNADWNEQRWAEALDHYRAARELAPESLETRFALARGLATCPEPSLRDPDAAVLLAESVVDETEGPAAVALDVLSAAYAGAGRFAEAAEAARRGARDAAAANRPELATALEARARQYAGKTPGDQAEPAP